MILVFMPSSLKYTGGLIIGIYGIFLAAMIGLYKKFQTDPKKGLFSYLNKNYVLRQSVNFTTTILIEILYMVVTVIAQNEGPYSAFVSNDFVIKGVPMGILSLLICNLGFNMFLFVKEVQSDNLLVKGRSLMG